MKTARDAIVIGASPGGLRVLRKLVASLPAGLPAAIIVVQHMAPDSPRLNAGPKMFTADQRSLSNPPIDTNSLAAQADHFHGIDPETAHDPGRRTPGAPKADNRS